MSVLRAQYACGESIIQVRGHMAIANRSALLTFLFSASCVVAFGCFIIAGNDFNNDDIDNFTIIRNGNLLQLMMTPLHGHWSPFHRFSTWLVYAIAPMRFEPAVILLMIFHAGTLVYLYATLRKIGLDLSGKVITCAYAACGLLIYGMIWWANAQLRVPHVLLCAAAIYHYIAWLKGGGKWQAGLATAAFLLDLCVYQKAVLIPVYMIVAGFLAAPDRFRAMPLRTAAIPAVLLALAFAYTVAYTLLLPPRVHPGVELMLASHWTLLKAFFGALLGATAKDVAHASQQPFIGMLQAAGIFWLCLFITSLRLAPGTWKLWLLTLLMVTLDFLPLITSDRVFWFGQIVPYSYRYHFETVYLVALFAGFICAAAIRERLRSGKEFQSPALAAVVVALYAGLNVAALGYARSNSVEFEISRNAHVYMGNLREGLARQVKEPQPKFRDTAVPGYMSILVGPDRSSQLVPLFLPDARFDPVANPYYEVLDTGEVVRRPGRK